MSKLLLVGSVAARRWFSDFREPKDIDYLGDDIRLNGKTWTILERPNYNWLVNNWDCATPSLLYTIKLGHASWNIHWDKTAYDIQYFQSKGVEPDPYIYGRLYKDNELVHGKKQAYLDKTNDDFFTDGVKRKYVHDDLHLAMAFYDRPLYERCKLDLGRAAISKQLFYQLSDEDQLRMALEEIYVTALERECIPKQTHPIIAAKRAVKLLITSMCKGWFVYYLLTHLSQIYEAINRDYVLKFNDSLDNGEIREIAS